MERHDHGKDMLQRIEHLRGDAGLFSEEADGGSELPMIFSHAEYARAVPQLADISPRGI